MAHEARYAATRGRTIAIGLGVFGVGLAPAGAQEAEDGERRAGMLEEIIVTARFREERLQQTPVAISAFSGDSLEVRGITAIEQIGDLVPNAHIRPEGATPIVGMRGKVNEDFTVNFQPTVAAYIDDTYYGRQVGMNLGLYDVERVEVLRGPQGTLFGVNALGGAIRLITPQPQGDNSGYAELSWGRFNQVDLKGAFDFALSDNIYMRVTGTSESRDGYIDRLDFTCQMVKEGRPELAGIGDGIGGATQVGTQAFGRPIFEPVLVEPFSDADNRFSFPSNTASVGFGGDGRPFLFNNDCKFGTFRGVNRQGGRVQLRFVGAENVEVQVSADITNDRNEAFGSVMKEGISELSALDEGWINGEIFPAFGLGVDVFTNGTPEPNDGAFFRPPESFSTFETLDDPINNQNFDQGSNVEHWGVETKVIWDITDTLEFTYIGSLRRMDSLFAARSGVTQGDNTPFDDIHQTLGFDHEQVQQEFRINGLFINDRLELTAGLFYWTADEVDTGSVEVEPLTFFGLFPNKGKLDSFETDNQSLYTHLTFDLTPQLTLTAGLRFTDEERTLFFNQPPVLVSDAPIVSAEERTDWRFGLDYRLSDDQFVYGSLATGFRGAGFNPRPWTPSQVLPFEQEEVESLEIGYKADFFENRLRVNLAAFRDDYAPRVLQTNATQCNEFDAPVPGQPFFDDDLVQPGDLCPPGTPMGGTTGFNFSPFISAPGTVEGLEFELRASLTDYLTLTLAGGYNTFESDATDPEDLAFRHPDMLLQPENNYNAGLQYVFNLTGGGRVIPRLDWVYQGENTNGDPRTPPGEGNVIPSYDLYNFRLTYENPASDWRLALAVRNLTDEFYWHNFVTPGGFGVPGSPGAPRQWSFSFRRNFQ